MRFVLRDGLSKVDIRVRTLVAKTAPGVSDRVVTMRAVVVDRVCPGPFMVLGRLVLMTVDTKRTLVACITSFEI